MAICLWELLSNLSLKDSANSTEGITWNQILSGDFQQTCDKMQAYIASGVWSFLKFYKFKKLRPLFLYLIY